MKLIQRIGYYLGGFSLGLIILAFFLNGKKTSCSYGPDARVLKNINSKKIIYSDIVNDYLSNKTIDSLEIQTVLKKGDINFSNSETRKKPCGVYIVEGSLDEKEIILTIENCDSIATILNLKIE
ncbi:hypothetical protein SAMN05428642_102220 [Flaviramulus basaltis]|uniref:DUF4258 domain-containing protein n=1 Tax=Flaviramulus basaltis TaxID=369401 RepID=A0A1K2IHE7_9FLAO|nr:hypothetical protein [Flaviramulus basaltis]SFZ91682.1 hypothetical protein SAMN05428642_102220 [Flaviramulus basaltis]